MTAARYFPPYQPTTVTDPWMTVDEISRGLRISKMTVYRAIHGDYLRSQRVGRGLRVRTSWYRAWVADGAPTSDRDL